MFRRVKSELAPPLAVDAVFAVALGIFYVALRSELEAMLSQLNTLFLASYAALGLSVLLFYLLQGMNPKAADLLHVVLFPLLVLLYTFLRWMPDAVAGGGITLYGADPQIFSAGMLVFLLMLAGYFLAQLRFWMAGRALY